MEVAVLLLVVLLILRSLGKKEEVVEIKEDCKLHAWEYEDKPGCPGQTQMRCSRCKFLAGLVGRE